LKELEQSNRLNLLENFCNLEKTLCKAQSLYKTAAEQSKSGIKGRLLSERISRHRTNSGRKRDNIRD